MPTRKELIFPIFLFILVVVISWVNYRSGTWLSGWDTLHPEFNFPLYFKRIFFGVWQEHQGLGALAVQSHAGELPRMILYYLSSFFLPNAFLRYGYFLVTLIIGPLGVYFFLKEIVFKNLPVLKQQAFAFTGALIYLLNLGTLQLYYLPLEMFATHFATLPWLFLFAMKYLEHHKKKDLFFFSLITFFSTSISHTPTLFYAYFLGLFLFILTFALLSSWGALRRALIILGLTLVLNSFWLFPNIYFVVNHGQDVSNSKIHVQFSDKAFLTSKKFASIDKTAILKNFLFDWGEYDRTSGQFVDLFNEWKPHLVKPLVQAIEYGIFSVVMLGIFLSIWKKQKYGLSFLPIFLVSFFAIANNTPPFNLIFPFLQGRIPLFQEALRFPFTKFSILLMFSYAFYFALAISFIAHLLSKRIFFGKRIKKERIIVFGLTGLISVALFFFLLPAFSGNLISPTRKVNFPKEYFLTFDWLNKQQDTGRIANFPVHTFWGWVYYDWHYEGAGFLWFGLEQPILDREFDRWSPYNENYYWEVSYAVYSGNKNLLEKVLEKYQVKWLLVDESVINPSSAKSVYFDKLEELLFNSDKVTLAQEFGKIKIYEVSLTAPVRDFVYLAENLPTVGPEYKWNNFDSAYIDNGNYITAISDSQLATSYYPFRSLFSGKNQEDIEFSAQGGSASGGTVEDKGDYFLFKRALPSGFENYSLEVPEINPQDFTFVDPSDLSRVQKVVGDIYFDGQVVAVKVPKIGGYYSAEITPLTTEIRESSRDCEKLTRGFFRWTLAETTDCLSFPLANLPHNLSYLITVESKNDSGKSLLFWLENLNSRRADIETYLPKSKFTTSYFIQPPMEEDGVGYTLHFDNISIGNEKSVNELEKVTVNIIPYKFLAGLVLVSPDKSASDPRGRASKLVELNVRHPNPSTYVIVTSPPLTEPLATSNLTLVLSQSYEKGWKAYKIATSNLPLATRIKTFLPFVFGEEIKEHVLVNNWANGWVLGNATMQQLNNAAIVIIYLPQYLEFAGFGLIIVISIIIVLTSFAILTKNKTSI